MPSYGENQKPAGKDISPKCKPYGTRVMKSNNSTITPTLKKIDRPGMGLLALPFFLARRS